MDAVTDEKTTRRKSLFVQRGNEAKAVAQRELLLQTLEARRWHLTATSRDLGMGDASAVIRAIHALGLTPEYERARGWTKVAV